MFVMQLLANVKKCIRIIEMYIYTWDWGRILGLCNGVEY